MSAHRTPDQVRDYCENARMRGLKVIIAGAGMSAALPGVAAAHTDLPVIGVPISGRNLGGLDALLSACRCRPACRSGAWRSTGRRTRPAGGPHNQRVIPRYTRDEMGSVWTPRRRGHGGVAGRRARGDRRVGRRRGGAREAAEACRERASFEVEAVEERERTTGHDVAAFVDVVAASVGEEGRWIHFGLTSSDVLDTGLAIQLTEAGEIIATGARSIATR